MKKFYNLSPAERIDILKISGLINDIQKQSLSKDMSPYILKIVNSMSENVVSGYYLPFSVVPDVKIDNRKYLIPMVTEESSVVAAINNAAKLIRESGKLETFETKNIGVGQIFFPELKNPEDFCKKVYNYRDMWTEVAHNSSLKSMKLRGGGIVSVKPKTQQGAGIINFQIDTCDAMGANIINQTLESLSKKIEHDLSELSSTKILSNLSLEAITKAKLSLNIEANTAKKFLDTYKFACIDNQRACTHNKGIMNGIEAILLATGNDTRAVSSSMHAYAAIDGYKPMSSWSYMDGKLIGELAAPINVGIVGGITKIHPLAKLSIDILKINSSVELARICAAVGLMQNLTAILALSTKGICSGHMNLHIENILSELNIDNQAVLLQLKQSLMRKLSDGEAISVTVAKQELNRIGL